MNLSKEDIKTTDPEILFEMIVGTLGIKKAIKMCKLLKEEVEDL